jgi:hypothetical protein
MAILAVLIVLGCFVSGQSQNRLVYAEPVLPVIPAIETTVLTG